MTGGSITTSARGGNGLVATNGGTVTISGTTIKSTGSASARGLHATYGGVITASDMDISSTGGSCATLATDRGEGTVSCSSCTLSTEGAGSPLIYSTGNITVSDTTGTASAAQAVVVEGKNSATIKDSELKCTASPNNNNDECAVLIYQSMSGDAESGTSSFNCEKSTIEILSTSSYYTEAPIFYITNTDANIDLNDCTFTYGSNEFMVVDEGNWGNSGSNGGSVILTLTNQNIEGDIIVGSSSSLTIKMVNSSIKGTINGDKTASELSIELDSDSTITLTGNSYYTSLTNAKTDGSNINKGSYSWGTYDESSESSSSTSNEVKQTTIPTENIIETTSSTEQNASNTNETNTTNTTIIETDIETTIPENSEQTNTSIVLLGYSHFHKSPEFFTFNIYLIPILNTIYSKYLSFPISVIYDSRLRILEDLEGNCTLEESEKETDSKVQYSCEVKAITSNIKQIKIHPDFKFGSQSNVNLAGITPLANMFMDNLQDVGDNFNGLSNSTVYILDHSLYNKYDENNFIVSGEMKDPQPSFGKNTNFVLRINTNSTSNVNQVEANCTIAEITGKNYTLNCNTNDDSDLDLQSAFSFVENDILLVNFDRQINNSTDDGDDDGNGSSGTSSYRRYNFKKDNGLKAGHIVAIVVAPVVALAVLIAAIFFSRKNNAKVNEIGDSQISNLNKV